MSNTQVKQVLIGGRNRLSTKGWTRGVSARNAAGERVSPAHPEAVCFCTIGAVYAEAHCDAPEYDGALMAIRTALNLSAVEGVGRWNDHPDRTLHEVLAAFDKAIEACA